MEMLLFPKRTSYKPSRATVKSFNSMLNSKSEAFCQVLRVYLHLADEDDSCWSAHVFKASSGIMRMMRNEDIIC
eukprot:1037660-Pelagomonas_calceolata.AAC.1